MCVHLNNISVTQDEICLTVKTLWCISLTAARAGSDYHEASSRTMVFPPGSANGDMRCLNITIVDDGLIEGDEYFYVYLSLHNSYVNYVVGVRRGTYNRRPTLVDNDGT